MFSISTLCNHFESSKSKVIVEKKDGCVVFATQDGDDVYIMTIFVFVFIIFPLILIGYNFPGYGNSQYP